MGTFNVASEERERRVQTTRKPNDYGEKTGNEALQAFRVFLSLILVIIFQGKVKLWSGGARRNAPLGGVSSYSFTAVFEADISTSSCV